MCIRDREEFAERLRYYGDYFWLMFEDDKLIAFVDGFVTDEKDLTDEMYEKASMHNEDVYKRQCICFSRSGFSLLQAFS